MIVITQHNMSRDLESMLDLHMNMNSNQGTSTKHLEESHQNQTADKRNKLKYQTHFPKTLFLVTPVTSKQNLLMSSETTRNCTRNQEYLNKQSNPSVEPHIILALQYSEARKIRRALKQISNVQNVERDSTIRMHWPFMKNSPTSVRLNDYQS